MEEGFVVGIDLGTSNMIGLLGQKNEFGVMSILASESIPSGTCIKHGVVYNIDDTAGRVKKLLNLLENKTGKKIGKAYVSVAGMSLKAIEDIQTKKFGTETSITFSILDQMKQLASMSKPSLLSIYSTVSPEIYLDGKLEEDPIDKRATTIETRCRLIAGRPNIKSNLSRCISEKNRIEIAGYTVGPIATGAILLNNDEKKAGCALVDFGGGTTTVTIYKDGFLRSLIVIPFGGRTITRDIQDMGFTEDLAELYKIRYGKVGKNKVKTAAEPHATTSDPVTIDLRKLDKVIQLRQDEIILNVINQINESGYGDQLDAGIFITGGASQMTGLVDFFAEKAGMTVQVAGIKHLFINNAVDLLKDPSYSQCLGVMLFAKENCEKVEVSHPQPITSQTQTSTSQAQAPKEESTQDESDSKEDTKKSKGNNQKKESVFSFFGKIGDVMFKGEE